MSKRSVAVCKTGSPCYFGLTGSARGDADTPAVVQHLLDRGDIDVVFFGPARGEFPAGLTVVDPDMGFIDSRRSADDRDAPRMAEAIDPLVKEHLLSRDLACWVDVTGPEVSWTWPDNPNLATVLVWSAKYGAPCKRAMRLTPHAPRLSIVTDPKCYPRDGEMTMCWPELIPKALLSQETTSFTREIMGTRFQVKPVNSRCENWLTNGWPCLPDAEKQHVVHTAANAHLKDARAGGNGKHPVDSRRGRMWTHVLSGCDPDQTRICGVGWEHHPWLSEHPESWVGVLPGINDVKEFISLGECGPVVPQKSGFNSTKPRLHALCGSVPRLFGTGVSDMTYDPHGLVLSLDHPARWPDDDRDPWTNWSAMDLRETIELVLANTTPDFSLLDEMLDLALTNKVTWPAPEWVDRFGGYVPW